MTNKKRLEIRYKELAEIKERIKEDTILLKLRRKRVIKLREIIKSIKGGIEFKYKLGYE